jgi:hypothetical protein
MKKVLDVDYKQMAKDIGAEDIEKKADSIRAIATIKEEKFPDAWKWSVVAFERASGLYRVVDEDLPMNNPYFDA